MPLTKAAEGNQLTCADTNLATNDDSRRVAGQTAVGRGVHVLSIPVAVEGQQVQRAVCAQLSEAGQFDERECLAQISVDMMEVRVALNPSDLRAWRAPRPAVENEATAVVEVELLGLAP